MILDSHCHAWRRWPYDADVPDPEHRGSVEALLYEMDRHDVERAAVVCGRIGRDVDARCANDDNNDYVASAVARHPDRLVMFVDLDSAWSPEYHTPGAAARLRQAAERYGLAGFTHYVREEDDGWLASDDGRELFSTAAELDLIASLAVFPAWQSGVRTVALDNPTLPILLHHQGVVRPGSPTFEADLQAVLANAQLPGLHVKLSGFHYLATEAWGFPYDEVRQRVVSPLLAAFGAHRLAWGSDFPAARRYVTYRQSLEVVRGYAGGLGAGQLQRILGGTLDEILRTKRPARPPGDTV